MVRYGFAAKHTLVFGSAFCRSLIKGVGGPWALAMGGPWALLYGWSIDIGHGRSIDIGYGWSMGIRLWMVHGYCSMGGPWTLLCMDKDVH